MKNSKSLARLRWEAEYREQRRDAAWEWVEDYLARNPMGLSPRAMSAVATGRELVSTPMGQPTSGEAP